MHISCSLFINRFIFSIILKFWNWLFSSLTYNCNIHMNRNNIEINSILTNQFVINNVWEEDMKLYSSADLNEEFRNISENSSLSQVTSILTFFPKFSTKSSLFLNKYKGFLVFKSPMNFWIGILMLFLMIVPHSIIWFFNCRFTCTRWKCKRIMEISRMQYSFSVNFNN